MENEKKTSLSLLLTTIGRPDLKKMLDSIVSQAKDIDYLTVVVDGPEYEEAARAIWEPMKDQFKCNCQFIVHPENLGYWGHPLRNFYQKNLQGDFILHCDDDDYYLEGALDKIREVCVDKNLMYVFKMWIGPNGNKRWLSKRVVMGNIGTPMGIIPNNPSIMGNWKNFVGGDGKFFEQTLSNLGGASNARFVDFFIYMAVNT